MTNPIRAYLNELFSLMEGRLDLLKKKYKNISSDEIEEIYALDPSKTKKYSNWMIQQFVNGYPLKEIHSTIIEFEKKQKVLPEQDIEKYKTLDMLKTTLSNVSSKSEEKRKVKKEGSKKIYEDEQVLVIRLDSKEACITYGKGSKWCIAQKDEQQYERYKSNNVIFYFLLSKIYNDSTYSKIAISVERDADNNVITSDLWDAKDKNISLEELRGLYINGDEILSICIENAKKQESSILSKIFNGTYSIKELHDYLKFADINSEFFVNKILRGIQKEHHNIIIDYIDLNDCLLILEAMLPKISNENMTNLLNKGFFEKIIHAYRLMDSWEWVNNIHESLIRKIIETNNIKAFFLLFESTNGRRLIHNNFIVPIEDSYFSVLKELRELENALLSNVGTSDVTGNLCSELAKANEDKEKVTKIMTDIISNYFKSIRDWNLGNILLPED